MRQPWRMTAALLAVVVVIGVLLTRPARNGPVLRTMALGAFPGAMAVAPAMGRVFITSYGRRSGQPGLMRTLDTRTGTLLRTATIGQMPDILAADERTGYVFLTGYGSNVRVLDGRTGEALRTPRLGQGVSEIALDARAGRAFAVRATPDGHSRVEVWDMRGRRLGTLTTSRFPMDVTVNAAEDRLYVSGMTGDGSGLLQTRDLRDGRLVRRVTIGAVDPGRDPAAVVADARLNRAFVLNWGEGSVSVLDARSGAVLRTVPVGQSPGALALDDRTDRLFVVNQGTDSNGILPTERGSVSVLDARTGALLRTVPVGWVPRDVAVDERRGYVLVVNSNTGSSGALRGRGSVSVLDAHSGTLRRTITIGAAPVSVAVDEPTGHAFVLSEGGTIPAPDTAWRWLPSWLRRRLPFLPPPSPRTRTLPASVTVLDPTR